MFFDSEHLRKGKTISSTSRIISEAVDQNKVYNWGFLESTETMDR